MWMRRGKGPCWTERDPNDLAHVNRAIEDLMRGDDDKPSFFRAGSCEEILGFAELYAITRVRNPQPTDFLLLPESLLAGFLFSSEPDANLHPALQQRHFELKVWIIDPIGSPSSAAHLQSYRLRDLSGVFLVKRSRTACATIPRF
jgi:hypothetical protein